MLGPPMAAAISAACAARAKVERLHFLDPRCPGSAAKAACVIRALRRAATLGARAPSGPWFEAVGREVDVRARRRARRRHRMRRPDRAAQRQGLGLETGPPAPSSGRNRDQRAVLAILAVLLVRAARHIGRHRRHVCPAVRRSYSSGPRRHQRRQRQANRHKDRKGEINEPAKIHPPSFHIPGNFGSSANSHTRQWTIGFLIWVGLGHQRT